MTLWYTARAAGLTAFVLLTATVALGALVGRPPAAGAPASGAGSRLLGQYLHRVTAALGLGVLALHVGTILADSYAHVGVVGAVVPFTSGYRATAVGLGTIAAYLLLIVSALGFARGRLATRPRAARSWRRVHLLGYAVWPLALLHGLLAGTDTDQRWMRLLLIACVLAVVTGTALRVARIKQALTDPRPDPRPQPATVHSGA